MTLFYVITARQMEAVDHNSSEHDWESCAVCVEQAIKDGMLEPGSKPFGEDSE